MRDNGFAEYATARWRSLVGSAVLLGCPPADAEDLAQVTLMRAYAAWEKVVAADRRDAYVHTILLNAFRERHRRRRWRELSVAQPAESPSHDVTTTVDDSDAVVRALQRLSEGQRIAIVLRYWAQLSDQQVAETLSIPIGTVKSRIARGLDLLARDSGLNEIHTGGTP